MRRLLYFFICCFVFSNAFAGNYHWLSSANEDSLYKNGQLPIPAAPCPPDSAVPDTITCTIGVNTLTLIITGTNLKCNSDNSGTATVAVSGGVAPYTYDWSPSGQTTPTATGFNAGIKSVEVWDNTGVSSCIISINLQEPSPIFVGIIPPAPQTTCFGICDGSVTASPITDCPPVTYLWSNGDTNALADSLCTGTYTVTVTDAKGCTKTKTAVVGQPPLLNHNGTSTNITCFGLNNGGACVAPSGGTAPYTYLWSPGGSTTSCLSALSPTPVLTCTVTDANGCVAVYSTSITEPPLLTVTVTGTNLLCNGVCTGSVTATASGGTGAYTYSWAPGGCTTSACTGLCSGTYTLTLSDANGCTATATVTLTQPPVFTVSPTGTNITCFGFCDGTVSANPAGGTPPYIYSWSPGGCTTSSCSGLCPNTYSVTATDFNGCTATGTITITEPPLLTLTVSATNITCNGLCDGTVTATAAGGTPAYTYAWSNGCTTSTCTGLCAGTYTVTLTDNNGCIAVDSITVIEPAAIVLNLSMTPATCTGICDGSVSAAPTGGTLPYTYSWAPGGCTTSTCTGLCAGTYTLNFSDANGCAATGTIVVTQPTTLSASILAAPNPLDCNGDCDGAATVSVSGGTPVFTYLWSSGCTDAFCIGLCAGGYTVDVTDANGCTATANVTFTQPALLSATVTPVNPSCNSLCNGSISASVSGGNLPYTYTWLPSGCATPSCTGLCAGTYTLTVTDSKGCSLTQTITLTDPAVLDANSSIVNNVSCSGLCDGSAVSSPTGGTLPYTFSWSNGQTTSTATGLCAGTHTITVTDANGCTDIEFVTITQPSVLLASISSTTSSCISCTGSATVTVSGGTTPYTYLWSDGQITSAATGLCITTYTIDVTDANGCTASATVTITPVVTLTVTASGTSVSCNGSCDGIASVSATGGFAPYTYSWAGGCTTAICSGFCAGTFSVTVTDSTGCFSVDSVTFIDPPALTTTMTSTTASCGLCNGTATSTPSGGTGGYTYTWSGFPVQTTATATGLCSGNYTVTVADANNCTTTNTVSVGNIPVISDNPSVTLATCGGTDGAICISPSGGTPGYTYVWSPGGATTACITGLGAGIDTVIITDAAGCSDTFAIAVGNISGPTVTVTAHIDPICNGECTGFISLTPSGGTPPYDFLWNPGGQTTTSVAGLCAGIYIVQVSDAVPCTTFVSDTLVDPPPIVPNPTLTNVSCNGGNDGSICVSPTGGTGPYTYSWSPGGQTTSCITALTAGCYTVIITDASACDDTIPICITEPAALSLTITATNVNCNGACDGTATVTVSGGTPTYTYSWNTIPPSPLPTIVNLCPGGYTVTVTDGNGCIATASATITEPTALTTTLTSTNASCNGVCDGTASISPSGGTPPYTYTWSNSASTSAITGLCVGTYIGTVTDANGCVSSQTATITEPAALSATVTPTNASCFAGCDGSAAVIVSGGTIPYTYFWDPVAQTTSAATGLCTGSYTITVTDTNGCSTVQLFPISSPPQMLANISTTSPSCFGGCDGTATSSPIGGVPPYTFFWSNGQTTSTATGLCAGNYTLTLSDFNSCAITETITITAPLPLSIVSGVAQATCGLCNGSISAVVSGGTSPYTYAWSPNTTDTTPSVTGLCTGVYIVTVTDTNGCTEDDTLGLSNTTGPTFSVTATTNNTCFNSCDGTATVTVSAGDGPPFTYLWNDPSAQTTSTATGLCAGQWFISVADTNGCVTIDDTTITEPAPLVSNAVITNATCFNICNGSIVLNPSGGTPPYTFSWSSGQTTSSITAQCPGTYFDTLTDANGCVRIDTLVIGQNLIVTSSITSTNDSCNGSCDGTATITVAGGTPPYTYSWAPSSQTTSAATGLCAGTQTLTITDALGCVKIDSAIITEPAVLLSNITGINPLCNTFCDGSVSSAPSGGTPPYTYSWSNGCSTSVCTGLCAGTYTLVLTDANNCSATNTITLTDPSAISLTDVTTNSSCVNTCDGSIDITPSGGTPPYTFLWSNAMTTEDVSNLCTGIYSVTITDANGCLFTDSMTVGINTIVIALAGNDTSFCLGGIATLCSGSINAASVAWYDISAGWAPVGITNCVSVTPAVVGVISYGLIAMNGICSDTDTVVVTVNSYPVLISSNDTIICQGDSATLCSSGANNYQWYTLPAWTPVATGNCITISPAVGTTSYGIIGMNGICSDTDSVSVTVILMPIAVAGNDTSNCFGDSIVLCSNSLNATSVTWYNLPAWTQIDTTVCITVIPPAGINDFALIADNGICSDTDTVAVIIYSLPSVDAGTSVTILSTSSTGLNGTGSGNYLWSPAMGLSCTTCANPTANPSVTTTYTLSVTDANGCVNSDTVRVTIITDVIVHDGLSPNGDGINDVWEIPNIEQFPDALVEIYNRWGELLFHSIGYKEKWDCKYNGNDLPVGTYYYVINLNSDLHPEPITGPITILR